MELTQKDLQAIGNLIDQRLDASDKNLDQRFDKLRKSIISQMKKETKQIVGFFDKIYLNHDKRIKRIENHLDLPPLND